MSDWTQRPDRRWVPAEPLPEAFGVLWERCWRFRHGRGERLPLAVFRGWRDARAVWRTAR
jgi:hypothetical protein